MIFIAKTEAEIFLLNLPPAAVHNFLELAYFSKLPSEEKIVSVKSTSPQPRRVLELEDEEFEDLRRATA